MLVFGMKLISDVFDVDQGGEFGFDVHGFFWRGLETASGRARRSA
jgi:hypothetical protein